MAIFFPGRVFRKLRASQIWRGGDPLPPTPLSIKVGGTLPPVCRSKWGSPPIPSRPGRANRDPAGKTVKFPPHDGSSTRTSGFGYAAREVIPWHGREGGDPPPPSPSFDQSGGHPPPHVSGQVGGPPLHELMLIGPGRITWKPVPGRQSGRWGADAPVTPFAVHAATPGGSHCGGSDSPDTHSPGESPARRPSDSEQKRGGGEIVTGIFRRVAS